jgi:DNA-binding transcriptional ArsR family regulator
VSTYGSNGLTALGDPTRRAILGRLAEGGEATVNELAEPFPISVQAVSHHLKVLERAGLIVRSREAQWRPSRLQADPLDEAVEWMLSRKATWQARREGRPTIREAGGAPDSRGP